MKFLGFYQTVMMAMGVMNGALFYGEFDGFGVGQWVCFVIGFVAFARFSWINTLKNLKKTYLLICGENGIWPV